MATLQKIRNKAGLAALIIGLALFAFIIGDFLNSGSTLFHASERKIAKIGDYSLDFEDYEARIREMEEVYKIQTGQTTLDENVSAQIRETVYNNIVREKLLDEQAEKLGVSVTGKELFSLINGNTIHPMIMQLPIFKNPQTGQFDRSIMMNFLKTIETEDLSAYPQEAQEQIKQLKTYWLFWENSLKYNRLEEKINLLLTKAVQPNSLDAKASYAERSETSDIVYTFKSYLTLSDANFQASKSEIKKRYNEEKERFRQDPFRSAKYIVVDVKPSAEDFKAVDKKIHDLEPEFLKTADLQAFVNENSDNQYMDCFVSNALFDGMLKNFVVNSGAGAYLAPTYDSAYSTFHMAKILAKTVAPDSVKARQIILASTEQSRADSLMAVLKNGGDFDKLARQFSRSNANPEMGWFREMDALSMGSDFVRACFSATLNNYFTVKTKNSICLVQVTEKSAPIAKTKLALVTLRVTPSSQTYGGYYNKVNALVAKYTKANEFFPAAQKAGFDVRDLQVVRSTDATIADVPQMRQAVRFVYTKELGDVSSILENQSNQFVVIGVTGIYDENYQPISLVQPLLQREIINDKKAERIMEDIRAKKASSLTALAQSLNARVDSSRFISFSSRMLQGIGEEPALVAAVSMAPLQKMSEPVKGKNGVYVFQVVSRAKTQEPFNLKQEIASLNGTNMYRLMYGAFEAVKRATTIKDNRIKFY
jgi:peptidyl-prolyl cis-trans isomerase D